MKRGTREMLTYILYMYTENVYVLLTVQTGEKNRAGPLLDGK